ncbi:MAG: hypothetical protein ACTSPQ_05055 [Candidatus Helarchaeota archaeon]
MMDKTGWVPASNYVGWDGLLANILFEYIFGIKYNKTHITFNPILPNEWNSSFIYLNLNKININMSLSINVIPANISVSIPAFHNITIVDLKTSAKNTYFTSNFQFNFTNFRRYLFELN